MVQTTINYGTLKQTNNGVNNMAKNWYQTDSGRATAAGSAATSLGSSVLGYFGGRSDRKRASQAQQAQAAAMREQTALDAKRLEWEQAEREKALVESKRQLDWRHSIADPQLSGESTARLGEAATDVGTQFDTAQEGAQRNLLSLGVNPNSGRFGGMMRGNVNDRALGKSAAINRERVRGSREGLSDKMDAADFISTGQTNYSNTLGNTAGVSNALKSQATGQATLGNYYGNQAAGYNQSARDTGSAISGLGQRYLSAKNSEADGKERDKYYQSSVAKNDALKKYYQSTGIGGNT